MGLRKDIKLACLKFWDSAQPVKKFTRFTHTLRDFDLPKARPLPSELPEIAILTPCKNAVNDLDRYFDLVGALDYPKNRVHLRVLEGDSTDDTFAKAEAMFATRQAEYASTALIKMDIGQDFDAGRRSRVEIQRQRRSSIAACRNRLMQDALDTSAEYFLFIDVDMVSIPPDALKATLAFQAPIMMANCLLENTEAVFDLNAFRYTRPISDRTANRYVKGEIYQPPKGYFREYVKFRDGNTVEQVHSVGGTFLLIRRDVVEAGVDFPEDPYQLHIETEGLALKASEMGFGSFVAPQVFVYHGWET